MSNIKIERHNARVEIDIRDAVLDLVSANVTSLSMTHPPADHPKFEAYRAALVVEVLTYLAMQSPHRIELVTVTSEMTR